MVMFINISKNRFANSSTGTLINLIPKVKSLLYKITGSVFRNILIRKNGITTIKYEM
jgi:hypothetical protein